MIISKFKVCFLLVIGFLSTVQVNAQLCGQYGVTLNIKTSEYKPIENAQVQLLSFGADQTKGKTFERDEKILSKFSITFLEGHQIANTYRLLVFADGFETSIQEIKFPHCERQSFDIKLAPFELSDSSVVSGTIKISKDLSSNSVGYKQKVIANVYIVFTDENGKRFSTASDKDGNYNIRLPIGKYVVYASETGNGCGNSVCVAEGFQREFIVDRSKKNLTITLYPSGGGG